MKKKTYSIVCHQYALQDNPLRQNQHGCTNRNNSNGKLHLYVMPPFLSVVWLIIGQTRFPIRSWNPLTLIRWQLSYLNFRIYSRIQAVSESLPNSIFWHTLRHIQEYHQYQGSLTGNPNPICLSKTHYQLLLGLLSCKHVGSIGSNPNLR